MAATATAPTAAGPALQWPLATDFEPRPFQLVALDRLARRSLACDIGLGGGKTTIALAHAEHTCAMNVLVLCPRKVMAVWPEEVRDNAVRDWVVWSGQVTSRYGKPLKNPSVARRVEAMIEARAGAMRLGRPFMAVVNYEAAHQGQMAQLLLGTGWDLVVCDESHKLAAPGGKVSKFVARVTERCRGRGGRILTLTGTFMPHSALSVYGQLRALDPRILGTSWTAFKAQYAKWKIVREVRRCTTCQTESRRPIGDPCDTPGCPGQVARAEPIYLLTPRGQRIPDGVKPEAEEALLARIKPHVLRVSQQELDELTGLHEPPPQIRTTQLRPPARRVYDALERDLIAQVAGGTVTAANAMLKVLRLAQVTSGYGVDAKTGVHIPLEPGRRPEKAELLADELDDLPVDEPVVVFARFHHDLNEIEQIAREQGRRYGEISGRRDDGLVGHLMNPNVDVVGVQPQAGGAGVNLTRARIGIAYSPDFNLANYLQCWRRILRQGQTRSVAFLHLAVEDTVDIPTFFALKHRKDVTKAILDRLNPKETP